ncbi:hypothetical protein BGS_1231 [Beggiatoa sp. SS]|nr:hypothetical protein BGS_1231 [Beggiatoa sp. SS]
MIITNPKSICRRALDWVLIFLISEPATKSKSSKNRQSIEGLSHRFPSRPLMFHVNKNPALESEPFKDSISRLIFLFRFESRTSFFRLRIFIFSSHWFKFGRVQSG